MLKHVAVFSSLLFLMGCEMSTPAAATSAVGKPGIAQDSAKNGPAPDKAVNTAAFPDFANLVEAEGSKVVHVRATQKNNASDKDVNDALEFLKKYMPKEGEDGGGDESKAGPSDKTPKAPTTGIGSGFFITADGYILTNAHVVDKADSVVIKTLGKKELAAKIIGIDTRTDVALLKVPGGPYPFVRSTGVDNVRVGSWAVAIGSPFGMDNSVTAGIVSAKGRFLSDENYLPFIQSDVAINPGNSGGPLFNLAGEVIGMNTQIYSRTGGYMGMSFAIPIDSALKISEQLMRSGKVQRSRMGIRIQEVSSELASALKLPINEGAIVAFVDKNSPAELGGMKIGDVILDVGGIAITSPSQLTRIAAETPAGSVLKLSVLRENVKISLSIKVVDAANSVASTKTEPKNEIKPNAWGLSFAPNSLVVEKAVGVAGVSGILKGDIVRSLQNKMLHQSTDIDAWIAKHPDDASAVLLIQRGDNNTFIVLDLTDIPKKK